MNLLLSFENCSRHPRLLPKSFRQKWIHFEIQSNYDSDFLRSSIPVSSVEAVPGSSIGSSGIVLNKPLIEV